MFARLYLLLGQSYRELQQQQHSRYRTSQLGREYVQQNLLLYSYCCTCYDRP